MRSEVNVGGVERWASALGGAALAAYGAKHAGNVMTIAVATGLDDLFCGARGVCRDDRQRFKVSALSRPGS